MKKFLFNLGGFGLFITIFSIFSLMIVHKLSNSNFSYKIDTNKNMLLVGDSYVECAVNDNIVRNVTNLGDFGSSYYYSYLKIRELTNLNKHIDTVIIGFSYQNLYINRFTSIHLPKIANYFPLLKFEDYCFLFKENPIGVIRVIPRILINSPRFLLNKYNFGGYRPLKKKLKKTIKNKNKNRYVTPNSIVNYSKPELKYLKKIYQFCQKKGITIILLHTPVHKLKQEPSMVYFSGYCNFYKEELPKAILVDHSRFELPDWGYGDLDHLNFKGAKLYSQFLLKNKFRDSINHCR